jgi:cell division septation protein DedD
VAAPVSAPAAFRIQIAATNSASTAEQVLRRAKSEGFNGVIVEEGGYHKVRLGSYASRGDATAALAGVKSRLGGAPFVVGP